MCSRLAKSHQTEMNSTCPPEYTMDDRELPELDRLAELSLQQRAELSRLRAAMGFIPSAPPRLIAQRYELVKSLGSGGMGVVYLARDTKLDNVEVAIKLVREKVLREVPGAPLALQREAQQMAKLRNHPNVVEVFDVGTTDTSTFLTMERVEGSDLRRWLHEGERSQRDILRAFVDAARGMAAAHAIGLIHRDFKPDNVLIDSQSGVAKVTDFGIATLLEDHLETQAQSVPRGSEGSQQQGGTTQHASMVSGTMPYMAPERLAGERADARSDQFSFCVSLWEALTGSLPYCWHDAATQLEALERPPANIRRIPHSLAARVLARSLRTCLLEGMSHRRADRHPDMAPIITALEFTINLDGKVRRFAALGGGLAAALGVGIVANQMLNPPITSCGPFADQVETHWNADSRALLVERSASLGVDASWTLERLDLLASEWSAAAESLCEEGQAPPDNDPERECLERWLPIYAGAIELFAERGDRLTLEFGPTTLARLAPKGGDYCEITDFVPKDAQLAQLAFEARAAAWSGDRELAEKLSAQAMERAQSFDSDLEYTVELAYAHAAQAEVLHRWEDYGRASEHWDEARMHALATQDASLLLASHLQSAWTVAHDEARDVAEAEAQLAMVGPLMFATSTSGPTRGGVLVHETRALLDKRRGRHVESATGYATAVEGYTAIAEPLLAARARIGWANLEYARADYDAGKQHLARARELLDDVGPSGYRDILILDADFDSAVLDYEAAYALDDDAAFAGAIEEIEVTLELVSERAPPLLALKALAALCQLRADTGRVDGLRELVDRARVSLAEQSPNAGVANHTRVQIELAALVGLDDPEAERAVRELATRRSLDLELRTTVAWSLLFYLEDRARCEDLVLALAAVRGDEALIGQSDFSKWVGERADLSCNE